MGELSPIVTTNGDLDEMRARLDSSFRNCMDGRQILSTLSESTLRRYRNPQLRPRRSKAERELLHRMLVALHSYVSEGIACASSNADFSSGLMATAASEGLAIVGLIQQKAKLRQISRYKKLWKRAKEREKVSGSSIVFGEFVQELRFDDLFRLAREVELYDERNLPGPVEEVLRLYGHPGRLTNFVHSARNCVHPRWKLRAHDSYAKPFGIYYSLESIREFHIDFALCAWTLYERVGNGLKLETD